ncbi:MAG: diaminopimelate decarboxylase, partial [Pseudonocardia sp.]|nr:diaminopimelate decarboxylase [Pseudonocardia sp.]
MTLTDIIPTLRSTCYARLDRGLWPASAESSCDGEVSVGGLRLTELAARFGTPLYVLDTDEVRKRCRAYRSALPGVE